MRFPLAQKLWKEGEEGFLVTTYLDIISFVFWIFLKGCLPFESKHFLSKKLLFLSLRMVLLCPSKVKLDRDSVQNLVSILGI